MGAVVDLLYDWGYTYVENLTWVYLGANNTILTLEAPYAQRSHLTLFIFRRDGREPESAFPCAPSDSLTLAPCGSCVLPS
jgi:hypothetical protein